MRHGTENSVGNVRRSEMAAKSEGNGRSVTAHRLHMHLRAVNCYRRGTGLASIITRT